MTDHSARYGGYRCDTCGERIVLQHVDDPDDSSAARWVHETPTIHEVIEENNDTFLASLDTPTETSETLRDYAGNPFPV